MLSIQKKNNQPILCQAPLERKPEELLIRVGYAGLCRTDVLAGFGKIPCEEERILGHECSGTVEALPDQYQGSLKIGDRVTIQPLLSCGVCSGCEQNQGCLNPHFLGLERDGGFAELLQVPLEAVLPIPDSLSLQKAAYVEPVAAALAVFNASINSKQSGLLLGSGRIANLTRDLLHLKGFTKIDCLETPLLHKKYDFIIETNIHHLDLKTVCSSLKDGGVLILKSRVKDNIVFPVTDIVSRNLRIQGVRYGSFTEAIDILAKDQLPIEQYLGKTYSLSEFIEHFQDSEQHKIFCSPNAGLH